MNTSQILSAIDQEISRLEQARSLLQGSNGSSTPAVEVKRRGRPPGQAKPLPDKAAPVKQTRTMSEDGRARIAAAQKARWALKKKADQKAAKAAMPNPAAKKTAVKKNAAPAKVAAKKAAVTIKRSAPTKAALPAKKAAARKSAPVERCSKEERWYISSEDPCARQAGRSGGDRHCNG